MFKKLFLFALLFPLFATAQKPNVNYGIIDSTDHSFAFKTLHNLYDEVIAYTVEGYWRSDRINYAIVASKNGEYFKGSLYLKRTPNNTWTKPAYKFKKVNPLKVKALLANLENAGLWRLNVDSLNNQEKKTADGMVTHVTLSDGMNFRFELFSIDKFLTIQSYEPDYFLKKMPLSTQRDIFIKIRDRFVKDYQAL